MPYTEAQGAPRPDDHVILDREITFLALGPRNTGVELVIARESHGMVQSGRRPDEVLVRFGEHMIRFKTGKASADLTLYRRAGEAPQ